MPSPFPGMDPYLEDALLWPNVHRWLLMVIAERIAAPLDPHYVVSVEERVYVTGLEPNGGAPRSIVPDVVVSTGEALAATRGTAQAAATPVIVHLPVPLVMKVPYLEVRSRGPSREVVTVLELLSPANKRPGAGREEYLAKRATVLAADTNLVEVDLLRAGVRAPASDPGTIYDYSVLVARSEARFDAELFPITLRDALPTFALPLRPGELGPPVPLDAVLDTAYDRGRLHLFVDYAGDPDPPLSPEDNAWAAALLRSEGIKRETGLSG